MGDKNDIEKLAQALRELLDSHDHAIECDFEDQRAADERECTARAAARELLAAHESSAQQADKYRMMVNGIPYDEWRAKRAIVPDEVSAALDVVNDAANDARHRGDYSRANALVIARIALRRAAQPASVADGQKPVVYCERIDGVGTFLGGKQFAHLAKVYGHPRLGDIPWARTSPIVSIETENTVYVVGKAAAPQPAQESE